MKTSLISLAAGVLFAAATFAAPAQAATFAFNFDMNGVSRATGSFNYDDKKTGILGFEDLTSFSLTTVGGAIKLENGTTRTFPTYTYNLNDILGLSNRYFGFDADTLTLAVQAFEGFASPLVFAAYDDAGTTGFLIDYFNNGTDSGSITDYKAGYVDGYTGVTLTAAAVPEPASWALMLTGFAMVGGVARYRRRATRVAFA
jgi:ABC-type amino acid transport substrate-binding protein